MWTVTALFYLRVVPLLCGFERREIGGGWLWVVGFEVDFEDREWDSGCLFAGEDFLGSESG